MEERNESTIRGKSPKQSLTGEKARKQTYTQTHTQIYKYTHKHTHTHTYTYTPLHTHTHTHESVLTLSASSSCLFCSFKAGLRVMSAWHKVVKLSLASLLSANIRAHKQRPETHCNRDRLPWIRCVFTRLNNLVTKYKHLLLY